MQELQPGSKTINAYHKRLLAYSDATNVPTTKRSSFLVNTIGVKTYAVLRSLLAPETPQAKPHKTFVDC